MNKNERRTRRQVLDDDAVVGVLGRTSLARGDFLLASRILEERLVEQVVGLDHIIDDALLRDLLALELTLGREIATVVVAEMVIAGDAERLDAGVDEELGEDALHLGLTGFEVVAGNEGLLSLGEGDAAGNEGVLRGTVDEGDALEDRSDGEDGRRRDLVVRVLDSVQEIVGRVVDAVDQIGVSLRVGGPENDDLVETVLGLEVADVLANAVEIGLLVVAVAGQDIVGSLALVGVCAVLSAALEQTSGRTH